MSEDFVESVGNTDVAPPPTTSVDTGGSVDTSVDTSTPSTEKKSVREHLTDGFARARARMGLEDDSQPQPEKPKRRREKLDGQSADAGAAPAAQHDPESAGTSESASGSVASKPPVAWSKDAKAAWASCPPAIQAAAIKREQDVEKGVLALRDHYKGLDEAIGKYGNEIKQLGLPAPQVIDNLFSWMKTIHGNPIQAIPALVANYKFPPQVVAGVINELAKFLPRRQGQPQSQAQGQPGQQPQQAPQIDPRLVNYLKQNDARFNQLAQAFQQEIGGIRGVFEQQSQAQTNAWLADWSRDKQFFNEEGVREFMARLITPDPQTGQSFIPRREDGRVDLEAAYDYAINALPHVRTKVLAAAQTASQQAAQARQKAEASAQTKAALAAARKNVGVTSSAPGGTPQVAKKGTGRRPSVRDTLMEAVAAQRERI